MKTIIAAILLTGTLTPLSGADCVCTFDGTEYEIKKGVFGLVYGTPIKKVPPNPTPTPTATPKPTPKPTATPTATPQPTATPSPTGTPVTLKSPHGIMAIGSQGYANTAANGERERVSWIDMEPTEGHYDWSLLDRAINSAKANNKHLGFSVAMLADPPDWLIAKGAKVYTLPVTQHGKINKIVLAWDPVVKPALLKFIAAFGAHADGKLDYVPMGGLGSVIESGYTNDPASIGLSKADAIAKWKDAANWITDAHSAAFKSTPFIFTAAMPFQGEGSALDSTVRSLAAKYGRRFGVMNCSLGADSTAEKYLPHKLVRDLSATNPTGLQQVCSTIGFNGCELGGTLKEMLDAGIALNAHFIEIYQADMSDPANAQMFIDASKKLKSP